MKDFSKQSVHEGGGNYIAPTLELLDVRVESGFAASDMPNGSSTSMDWVDGTWE